MGIEEQGEGPTDAERAEAEKFNADQAENQESANINEVTHGGFSLEMTVEPPEKLSDYDQRKNQREATLATGIDERARDPRVIKAAMARALEKGITGCAPDSVDCYHNYHREDPKGSEGLIEQLNKYPLVDLGSGREGFGKNLGLTNKVIVVEPYNDPSTAYSEKRTGHGRREDSFNPTTKTEVFNSREIHPNVFHAERDMLEFLTELPDGYCNVTMNNIDSIVINNQEFVDMLASQIERVLPSDGIFMTTWSREIRDAIVSRGFIDVTDNFIVDEKGTPSKGSYSSEIHVYQKPLDLIAEEKEENK